MTKSLSEAKFLAELADLDAGIDAFYANGPASFALFAANEVKDAHQPHYTCCPYPVALLKRLFEIAGERVPAHIAESDVRNEVMRITEMDELTARCQVRLCLQ